MQKVIADYRQYDTMLNSLKSDGYEIDKSQESFDFPGIFLFIRTDPVHTSRTLTQRRYTGTNER
jgi:hypothetical protein